MAEKRKANEEIEKLPENEQDAAWEKFFATHRHDVPGSIWDDRRTPRSAWR